jgi:XTP/dITP diphosphohydrolase
MSSEHCFRLNSLRARVKIYFASSNQGKLNEFRALATATCPAGCADFDVEPLPEFYSLPAFEENAPTFAENALGKVLHYSELTAEFLFADDSGLVVPALNGAPGVQSARYAGPLASDAERVAKLLSALQGKPRGERGAYFACAIAVVKNGRPLAIVSNRCDGEILESPRGQGGFGYDPIFYLPEMGKTFAELSPEEKNVYSHRGKAFRRVLSLFL